MRIVELTPGDAGSAVEALLDLALPARQRALAVLDGVLAGRAWVDDASAPTWAVVIETADGTVFGGGALSRELLIGALRGVATMSGDLIFGFSGPDDPMRSVMPADPYYVGEAIDFTDRVAPPDEDEAVARALAEGLQVADIDAEALPRIEWYEDTLHAFGGAEGWAARGLGRVVLAGDAVVAQAMAGPRVRGQLEMGVFTSKAYRQRGLGTLVSQLVARDCEARGDKVWWNASADNRPSQAIARRLGFRTERRYDLVAYRTDAPGLSP